MRAMERTLRVNGLLAVRTNMGRVGEVIKNTKWKRNLVFRLL